MHNGVILQNEDINRLVEIFSNQAFVSPIGPQGFFRDLVVRADLPQHWVQSLPAIFTGNARSDSRRLIDWALMKGVNPSDGSFTTLGSILQVLLTEVGLDIGSTIVALIVRYKLYLDKSLLESLVIRYQVPTVLNSSVSGIVNFGPEIDWKGPTEEVQLQSWLQSEPDFFDVGFLKRAIQQAAAVCRVETLNNQVLGTGFLIARNLLLTNYHVLLPASTDDSDAIEGSARNILLRFGCFTLNTGSEIEGQIFTLDNGNPILQYSPIEKLDYVLLRVNDKIKRAVGVTHVEYDYESLPTKRMGLNILQHPRGESMKVAFSSNGVTSVAIQKGLVQYVTKAAAGSSGSPCFNEDWKVVALHHAERTQSFGSIREGILFNSIHEEIKLHLYENNDA